jgi:hypothetical protein
VSSIKVTFVKISRKISRKSTGVLRCLGYTMNRPICLEICGLSRFGIRAQKLKNGSVRPVRERTAVQAADLQLSGQGG